MEKNYDFGKKDWGLYNSINKFKSEKEGFKIVLVKNIYDKYYLMAVSDPEKFKEYCKEKPKIIKWFNYRLISV